MRLSLFFGLVALTLSTTSAKERRSENKFRRYGPFSLKDKRGTDYGPGHISSPSGLFHPIMASISGHSLSRALGSYQQGFEQPSAGHGPPISLLGSANLGGHGLTSLGVSLGGHGSQTIYALPTASIASSSKAGPVMFGLQSGYSGSMRPIYATGVQTLSGYTSGPHGSSPVEASYGDPSTAGVSSLPQHSGTSGRHGYSLPGSSHAVTGGLVILDNTLGSYSNLSPSTSNHVSSSYHTGLSSGSSDSSSYHLPISTHSYPSDSSSYSKPRQPLSSSGSSYAAPSSYSFPSTNYGTPSNSIIASHSASAPPTPTVHYSPPNSYMPSQPTYNTVSSEDSTSGINYASPSASYSQSDYPNHSQMSQTYSYSEPQASYSHTSPMQSNYVPVKSYNVDYSIPKYDTISYSSPT